MTLRTCSIAVAAVTGLCLLPVAAVAQIPAQQPAQLTPVQPAQPLVPQPVAPQPVPVAPAQPFAPAQQFQPAMPVIQTQESQTVLSSIEVLQSFTMFKAQSIPHSMLADAQAIAIIPNVVKGGFVIAGRFGRGVLTIKNPDGAWAAPVFITFTGGSVGWQVGLQSSDVVLVFKNRKGVDKMLTGGSFTLGADASVAAGPVGRQASAGTDIKLNAEIFSYSRARGLFVGAALDGSVVKVDPRAAAAFYQNGTVMPEPATQLVSMVARDTMVSPGTVPPAELATAAAVNPETVRQELASPRVAWIRCSTPTGGPTWRSRSRYSPGPQPQPLPRAELTTVFDHYERVLQDPTYKPAD